MNPDPFFCREFRGNFPNVKISSYFQGRKNYRQCYLVPFSKLYFFQISNFSNLKFQIFQFQIFQFQIFQFQIFNFQNFKFQISNFKFQISNFKFQISNFKFFKLDFFSNFRARILNCIFFKFQGPNLRRRISEAVLSVEKKKMGEEPKSCYM
jgi:hypothetical protein